MLVMSYSPTLLDQLSISHISEPHRYEKHSKIPAGIRSCIHLRASRQSQSSCISLVKLTNLRR